MCTTDIEMHWYTELWIPIIPFYWKYWPVCVKPSYMLTIAKAFVHFSSWQCGGDSVAFLKHVFAFCVLFIHILHQNIPTTMTIIIKRNHIMELTRCEMFVFLIWSHLVLWLNWYNTMKRVEMVCKSEKLQRYYAPTLQYSLPIFRDNITCHWLWH